MISIVDVEPSEAFAKDLKRCQPDIAAATKDALKTLLENPHSGRLRFHPLKGHKPTLWKIDVLPNKSWQIVFELRGTTAYLLRLAPHKVMDGLY